MRIVDIIFKVFLLVVFFLYVGHTEISFSPFRFSVEMPSLMAGLMCAVFVGYCFYFDGYSDGYINGRKRGRSLIEKEKKVHDKKNGDLHELSKGNVKTKIKEP